MHRADPYAGRPSRRRRGRRDPLPPRGGSASSLLEPPGPATLTPRRARVTIREYPPRRRGIRIGGYRVHALDVIALLLGLAVIVAIVWPH